MRDTGYNQNKYIFKKTKEKKKNNKLAKHTALSALYFYDNCIFNKYNKTSKGTRFISPSHVAHILRGKKTILE